MAAASDAFEEIEQSLTHGAVRKMPEIPREGWVCFCRRVSPHI